VPQSEVIKIRQHHGSVRENMSRACHKNFGRCSFARHTQFRKTQEWIRNRGLHLGFEAVVKWLTYRLVGLLTELRNSESARER
jgi:hypothetical protein